MAGKRKREVTVSSRPAEKKETTPPKTDNSQDIFRKYFEAQFQPLDLPPSQQAGSTQANSDEEIEEDDSEIEQSVDSDWDGLSGDEEEGGAVEVVEHKDVQVASDEVMDKKARKAFLVGFLGLEDLEFKLTGLQKGKLPSEDALKEKPTSKPSKEEQEDDTHNLKHDLALQRLLKESHLLEDASDLAPTGKNRLRALDLRMQSLGAKSSLYKQEKMPSSHRIGIKTKAAQKEEKRRREAKENGIILEKPSKVSKSNTGRRERGVGGSSIGKFSGGTLNLSKRDLQSMSTPKARSGKGKKGRR